MFILSNRCYFKYYDDLVLVFNGLTGNVIAIKNPEKFKQILHMKKIDNTDDEFIKKLIKHHILIDESTDEVALSKFKFYSTIYDPMLSLVILPTEDCNFRCTYCYESFKRKEMDIDSQNALIKYVKKNLNSHTSLDIGWFGGEPLLAIDVIEKLSTEFIKMCEFYHKPYNSTMTTNGYLLNQTNFLRLRKVNVNAFQITLDGLPHIHNTGRVLQNGNGTFDVIFNNLKSIRDSNKSYTFSISIRTNVTKELVPYIDDYLELLDKEFGKDPRFDFYFRPVGDWGGDRVNEVSDRMVTSLNDFYKPIIESKTTLSSDGLIRLLNAPICFAARKNYFVIGSDATVYKCTMLLDDEINILGKINANGNMEINENLHSKWVARDIESNEKCRSCFYMSKCFGGSCPADNVRDTGGLCGYEQKSMNSILDLIYKDIKKEYSNAKVISIT